MNRPITSKFAGVDWAALDEEADFLDNRSREDEAAALAAATKADVRVRPDAEFYVWRDDQLVPMPNARVPGLREVFFDSGWSASVDWDSTLLTPGTAGTRVFQHA
jgi:hypothetical protein